MKTIQFLQNYSKDAYFWILAIIAVALPFFPKILVIGQILLVLNWLVEGGLINKLNIIYKRKSLLVFLALYAVHIVWQINSIEQKQGFTDLFMKLPLLIFPVILATIEPLPKTRVKRILLMFIISVVLSSIIISLLIFGLVPFHYTDVRDTSIFISPIRLSLMIVLSLLAMFHWFISEDKVISSRHFLLLLLCIWLFYFLILLKSLTGIIIFSISLIFLIIIYLKFIKDQFLKVGLIMIMYAVPLIAIGYVIMAYNTYMTKETLDLKQLATFTQNGKKYIHDTLDKHYENGHLVSIYQCPEEMRSEWNKRSRIKFDSLDLKKQNLSSTLTRYMTSKGLRKDSAGIWKLSKQDIANVENGMTNYIFGMKGSMYPRIYEAIWEIDEYFKSWNVNNHSITQRLAFAKAGLGVISEKPLFGFGTGGFQISINNYYKTHETGLDKKHQLHTHNQYLRFMVLFGILGLLIILTAIILPPFFERKWTTYYFLLIFIISFLSFINEDTLETQVGVTFFAFFYSLFLWGTEYVSSKQEISDGEKA
jgi:O-antigen ligase